MIYKLGSLFDGSGGFPLAGSLCGITPVWASEVEPYPIAVTRSRFPRMKHLGDISKINGAEIEPVDIITFGSPCQDLSVAGKRAGLKHEDNGDDETTRSGLFMEAIRIIKEMRRATNGRYPTFALWENVPGAFSSNKGEDFRIVLEELIKIVEPTATVPAADKNGWAYADCYMGDRWSLAYRTFDAQYWGVPQRRRRIHLVADFRGQRAGEILFKREGVRGYFEESRQEREEATRDAENCVGTADCAGKRVISDALPFDTTQVTSPMNYSSPKWGDPCHPLAAGAHPPAVICKTYDARGNGDGNTVSTLTGDHENRITDYTSVVVEPICGVTSGAQFTGRFGNKSETLRARDYKEPQVVVYPQQAYDKFIEDEVGTTLKACGGSYGGGSETLICEKTFTNYIVRRLTPTECARLQGFPDKWGHPDRKDELSDEEYRFWHDVRNTHAAINGKAVKSYTKEQTLSWYNKLHTDSNEYKMWGNGIALPPALYCMQGIAEALEGRADD